MPDLILFKSNRKPALKIALISAIVLPLLLAACRPTNEEAAATGTASAISGSRTPPAATASHTAAAAPTRSPTAVQRIELTDADLRGVVIHFWHASSGEGGRVLRQMVDQFNLSNRWRIAVVPVAKGSLDELYAHLPPAATQRNPPNLVIAYLHQAIRWDAEGRLVDLQAYAGDPVWGFSSEEQADFYPAFWEGDLVGGKRLGVPFQRSGQLIYYNRSWARDLGFALPPAGTQDFKTQACAAARANREDEIPDNDHTGGWIVAGSDRPDYSAMLAWIHAFGGEAFQVQGRNPTSANRSPYRFDAPQVEAAFSFVRGLYDLGCAWLAENRYPVVEFSLRQGLFASGSIIDLPFQAAAFRQAGSGDDWTVLPIPSPGGTPAIAVYGPSFEILESSPEQQLAAWVFIKWLLSPDNQARLVAETSAFPLRRSVLDHLGTYRQRNPQWAAAVEMLEFAHPEPPYQSWGTVRWALSDASTQLFRSYFTSDQVPNLIGLLEETAAELHLGADPGEIFATPLPVSPTP